MINLIIPAAGKSTRFISKPKWLLTAPNGNLMIQECIRGLNLQNVKHIYITVLKIHIEKYCKGTDITCLFNNLNIPVTITILDNYTQSQSETVFKTIEKNKIKGSVFIKDCDNFFEFDIIEGNYICSVKINKNNDVSQIFNKSFIQNNTLNHIVNICEKQIISNIICVGGYSFENTDLFNKMYQKCISLNIFINELFLSNIVHCCILEKIIFLNKNVKNYLDWGTQEMWEQYKGTFETLFIDIDGVIFYNSGEYFDPKWGDNKPILKNIEFIKKKYNTGRVKIILTTARKSSFKNKTIQQLKKYNIPYDSIIFDLLHSKRILINDFAKTNKYPTALSINIKRDSHNLEDYF